MKVFFRRIHLYLSLAAGLVILVACLTGAILVFEKDIQMALNKERYYVTPAGTKLPLLTLMKRVEEKYPDAKINGIKVYEDGARSTEINIVPKKESEERGANKKPALAANENKQRPAAQASTHQNAPRGRERTPGYTIFVNPYTGAVLARYSYRETFFYTVFALHRWLLGGPDSIGKYIVGISTLIFLFVIITGIILWWPKTRRVLVQRLKIKWDGGWKRLNHDLHIVLGFYSAIFLFIFAFTALAWSFEWFNKGIYTVTNSPLTNPEPPISVYTAGAARMDADQVLAAAKTAISDVQLYTINLPKDSTAAFSVSALSTGAPHESAFDMIYIDQYSGKVLDITTFGERSLGAQVRATFRPVHTGSIWGMPSKIIAFVTCLFGVSFPVTGVIMWINRTRKKSRKVVMRPQSSVVSSRV